MSKLFLWSRLNNWKLNDKHQLNTVTEACCNHHLAQKLATQPDLRFAFCFRIIFSNRSILCWSIRLFLFGECDSCEARSIDVIVCPVLFHLCSISSWAIVAHHHDSKQHFNNLHEFKAQHEKWWFQLDDLRPFQCYLKKSTVAISVSNARPRAKLVKAVNMDLR